MTEQAAYTAEIDQHVATLRALKHNDPPIEVNQVWVIRDERGNLVRGSRVLGIHPDTTKSTWDDGRSGEQQPKIIVTDTPYSRIKTYEIHVCPEYNLRRLFTLEEDTYHTWLEKEQYRAGRTCRKHHEFECTICIP